MQKHTLIPTPHQTFKIETLHGPTFEHIVNQSRELAESGNVEEACNMRFEAFKQIEELVPEDEGIIIDAEDRNSLSALEIASMSAIDHFLINDFEMSAAILEFLLDIDPEDHIQVITLLAFNYIAMQEYDSYEDIADDVPEKSVEALVLKIWATYAQSGSIPTIHVNKLRRRYAPYFAEFVASEHPTDEAYVDDINSAKPSERSLARELWLKTENLWALHPDFIAALSDAGKTNCAE